MIERARAVYEREPCARSFEEDCTAHLESGYLLSTPDTFALWRPVWWHWPMERLLDPWESDPAGDCWHIWLLAGDAWPVWEISEPKNLVAFERSNRLRAYHYGRIRNQWTRFFPRARRS